MVTEEEKKKIIIFPAQPIGCCYLPGPPKTDPGYSIPSRGCPGTR